MRRCAVRFCITSVSTAVAATVEVAVAATEATTMLGRESEVCRFSLEGEGVKFIAFGYCHRLRRSE